MTPLTRRLQSLASAIKLGLCPVPPDLSYAERAALVKLGVKLELRQPETRPWKLR